MDPLHRLAWQVLLQALADAHRERYSTPAVLDGLKPWAMIVSLPLDCLERTYTAARAGTLNVVKLRDVARSDEGARKRLREMGAPMREHWPGVKWEPERQAAGRRTWAENTRAREGLGGRAGPAPW